MKKFFVLLAVAMCFTGFYSCENNDEEDNQNNPPVQNYLTNVNIEKLKAISGFSREGIDSLMNANSYSLMDSIQTSGMNILMYATDAPSQSDIMYLIYTMNGNVLGTSYAIEKSKASESMTTHKEFSSIARTYADGIGTYEYSAGIADKAQQQTSYTDDTEYFQSLENAINESDFSAGLEIYVIDMIMIQNMMTFTEMEGEQIYGVSLTYLNMGAIYGKTNIEPQDIFRELLLKRKK